jgi:hypothetical protein
MSPPGALPRLPEKVRLSPPKWSARRIADAVYYLLRSGWQSPRYFFFADDGLPLQVTDAANLIKVKLKKHRGTID